MANILEREEYIEQAYFFRTFRERIAENIPAQEVLERLPEELLTTTRLHMAVQFLATELKHSGLISTGILQLKHYFTPYQGFIAQQAETEGLKFTTATALLILEREATYKSGQPTKSGLFVYQFEALCRNRLKYNDGIHALSQDPLYDEFWRDYLVTVRKQVGIIDFADLIYAASELSAVEMRRKDPLYVPKKAPLFGEKEGRIAKASRGRDPLFLFAALQRQLAYPEVPRFRPRDDAHSRLEAMQTKMRELEARLKLLESEARGSVDLSQFGKPQLLEDDE